MDQYILFAIIGVLALIIGLVAGKLIFAKNTKKQIADAEQMPANEDHEADQQTDEGKSKRAHGLPSEQSRWPEGEREKEKSE